MATSFRQPGIVVSRYPGHWINGEYRPENKGIPRNVSMSIYEPSQGDKNEIEALPLGRRTSRYIKIYTDERLQAVSQEPQGKPGDLIYFDQKTYLVIGESNFTMLKRTQPGNNVSHFRYYAAEIIEGEDNELIP